MSAPDPPLAASIPELLGGAALVALVPATADLDAAALMAWNLARITAAAGRRVALVDCHVDEPQLHAAAGEDNHDGIVDVFEYGASLSRIARQQPEPNLYFVPAGTFAPDPAVMAAHPRWRRLSAGFRHEDAVMLLFLPADCLGSLASVLDGMVALAPDGAEAGLASTPEIDAAADAGVPLLAALADTDGFESAAAPFEIPPERAPAEPAEPVAAEAEAALEPALEVAEPASDVAVAPHAPGGDARLAPFLRLRAPRRAWGARAAVYGALTLLAAAVLAVTYRRQLGLGDLGLKAAGTGEKPDSASRMSIVPLFRTLVPRAVDTLPFAVQVSAWTSLVFALDAADALDAKGFAPIIAPVRLGSRLWYRVYAGPVATQDAADSLLDAVWATGLDQPRTAVPVLAPLSLGLKRVATAVAARTERARLRAAGIPAFVLGQADGSYRLFAGAYAAPAQAGYLDSLVTSTGSAGQLGPRVGFRP
jgi:hypothetical protein